MSRPILEMGGIGENTPEEIQYASQIRKHEGERIFLGLNEIFLSQKGQAGRKRSAVREAVFPQGEERVTEGTQILSFIKILIYCAS